jgi:hypothetical protein
VPQPTAPPRALPKIVRDALKTGVVKKYMRQRAVYTWRGHKTDSDITKKLNNTPVLKKIRD